jgi:hypothetical protein
MGWAELVYSGQAELAHALAISKALEEERLREIKEAHAQASGAAAKPAPAAAPKQPALEVSRAELQPLPTLGKSSRDASAVLAMSSMRAEQEAKERLAEQEVCTAGTVRCHCCGRATIRHGACDATAGYREYLSRLKWLG